MIRSIVISTDAQKNASFYLLRWHNVAYNLKLKRRDDAQENRTEECVYPEFLMNRESWSIDFSWPLLIDQTDAVSPYGYPRSPLLWPPPPSHHTTTPRTRWRRRSPPSLPPPCSASGAEASATATASSSPRSVPAPPLPNHIVPPSRPLHAGSQRPRRRHAALPALLPPLRPRPSPRARRSKALLYFPSPSSPPSRRLPCSLLRNCSRKNLVFCL
jgi:hypothetical protein